MKANSVKMLKCTLKALRKQAHNSTCYQTLYRHEKTFAAFQNTAVNGMYTHSNAH